MVATRKTKEASVRTDDMNRCDTSEMPTGVETEDTPTPSQAFHRNSVVHHECRSSTAWPIYASKQYATLHSQEIKVHDFAYENGFGPSLPSELTKIYLLKHTD